MKKRTKEQELKETIEKAFLEEKKDPETISKENNIPLEAVKCLIKFFRLNKSKEIQAKEVDIKEELGKKRTKEDCVKEFRKLKREIHRTPMLLELPKMGRSGLRRDILKHWGKFSDFLSENRLGKPRPKTGSKNAINFRRLASEAAIRYHQKGKWSRSEEKVARILQEECGLLENLDYWHNFKLKTPNANGSVFEIDFYLPRFNLIIECLSLGSLVNTPKGTIEIEKLKLGDKILSLRDGILVESIILGILRSSGTTLIQIKLKEKEFLVSPGHFFFTDKFWVEAKDLNNSMRIIDYSGEMYNEGKLRRFREKNERNTSATEIRGTCLPGWDHRWRRYYHNNAEKSTKERKTNGSSYNSFEFFQKTDGMVNLKSSDQEVSNCEEKASSRIGCLPTFLGRETTLISLQGSLALPSYQEETCRTYDRMDRVKKVSVKQRLVSSSPFRDKQRNKIAKFDWSPIVKVSRIAERTDFIELITSSGNYFSNNCLSHNCDSFWHDIGESKAKDQLRDLWAKEYLNCETLRFDKFNQTGLAQIRKELQKRLLREEKKETKEESL